MEWLYSQMTDLKSLFDIWRFGTAQVFIDLLHIVRLIGRPSAKDNCVNAGLGEVLPLPVRIWLQNLAADGEKWCSFSQ